MFSLLEFLSLIELLNDFHDWKLTEIAANDVSVFFLFFIVRLWLHVGMKFIPQGLKRLDPS